MPLFEYKATDSNGQAVSGVMHSGSLVSAADELAKKGFAVHHVGVAKSLDGPESPASAAVASQPQVPRASQVPAYLGEPAMQEPRPLSTQTYAPAPRSAVITNVVAPVLLKVSLPQLLFFFNQLATMQNAGIPMMQSLETQGRQTSDLMLKPVVRDLSLFVRDGSPLSKGMERYPDVFTPLMLSLVRAGEEGGILDKTLKQCAAYIEQEIELRNLYKRATFYPKLVVGASILVVLATNYIIHSIGNSGAGLLYSPLAQPEMWIVLAPLIAGLFLFLRIGRANPKVQIGFDHFVMKVPGVGSTVHQLAMAKFGRAFAALYKAGVLVPKAIKLGADASGNQYIRGLIYPAAARIEAGEGVAKSLADTGAFTNTVIEMTNTGEQTGHLDQMLDKVADYYEEDSKVRARQMATLTGVVCFVLVAIYVGYMVVTFFTQYASQIQNASGQAASFLL